MCVCVNCVSVNNIFYSFMYFAYFAKVANIRIYARDSALIFVQNRSLKLGHNIVVGKRFTDNVHTLTL